MPRTITLTLSDDQLSSLEQYIKLPQFNPWSYSEMTKQNEPVAQFPTVESFIAARWSDLLHAAMKECPVNHIQAKLDQIKAIQAEITASAQPVISGDTN
jgi:dsRNA-specific ribonuclease